ncbi:putative DNA binding domain-containing protein [Patescibacteria group bacterium]|nr:putative DNA binding domain-containing protein [Patescibacteria group bacterium]MBU2229207.1 putative DNA binding domain-containing protein [Patescibacteria group bacterium]
MKGYIAYGDEERNWEFKPPFFWGTSSSSAMRRHEIAKTCFAMANLEGGGNIIIGIKQERSGGRSYARKGLTLKQYKSFDNKDDIARFINPKANQKLNIIIHGGLVMIKEEERRFIVIKVQDIKQPFPVISTTHYKSRNKTARIVHGALYYRTTTTPIETKMIETQDEWDELLLWLMSHREELTNEQLKKICRSLRTPITSKGKLLSGKKKSATRYKTF